MTYAEREEDFRAIVSRESSMEIPAFDLARARQDTPGCRNVLHFNNAGAALMPRQVYEAVVSHLRLEEEIGGYEAKEQASAAVERVYDATASLIGCRPEEVAFVENATRAWDMAFYSIPFRAGDRILTSMAEYASNYIAYLQVVQRTGAIVEPVPNDEHGQLSVDALRGMIDKRVKLITITHVPTNGGLVNPAVEVGKIAREAGILYMLDACQSVGQMPVNVEEIGCDILSTTGRKYLRGPRGTGILYVQHNLIGRLEPPFLDLHAASWVDRDRFEIRKDARRFENWEMYCAGKIGLGVAIDYAMSWGLDVIWARVSALAASLRACLTSVPGIIVRDLGAERCGIVTFTVEGRDAYSIQQELAHRKINVSVAVPEHTRLDMDSRKLGNIVRASVHYYNSEEEIDRFCAILSDCVTGRTIASMPAS